MKNKFKNLIKITAVVLLTVIFLAGCNVKSSDTAGNPGTTNSPNNINSANNTDRSGNTQAGSRPEEKVEIGYTAPDFSVELLDGSTVKLSDYRGKAVFLNFWATWCGYCVSEFPDIQKLSETYTDNLIVLAVDCSEDKNRVSDFITKNKYTFNVGLDTDGKIQGKYPTQGIPYTVVIDPNGIITAIEIGANSYETYEKDVKAALGLQ